MPMDLTSGFRLGANFKYGTASQRSATTSTISSPLYLMYHLGVISLNITELRVLSANSPINDIRKEFTYRHHTRRPNAPIRPFNINTPQWRPTARLYNGCR